MRRAFQAKAVRATLCAFIASCSAPEPRRETSTVALPSATSIEAQTLELASASQPTDIHKSLEPLRGSWDVRVVAFDAGGGEIDLAQGVGQLEWILDGRFLAWDATLAIAGAPRTTTGYLGFDLRTKQYQLLMISNLATGMSVAQGRGHLEREGLRFTLEQSDPNTGTIVRAISHVRLLARDHFVLDQLVGATGGEERVVRRTHYTRRNSVPAAVSSTKP